MQDFLRSHAASSIEHFTTWSDLKAAVVERFNPTLKTCMCQYFTEHQTHHYLDVLPQLVDAYNHSLHRSIGTTPAAVHPRGSRALIERVRERLNGRARPRGGGGGAHCTRNKPNLYRPHHHPPPPMEDAIAEEARGSAPLELRPGTVVRISQVKGPSRRVMRPIGAESTSASLGLSMRGRGAAGGPPIN